MPPPQGGVESLSQKVARNTAYSALGYAVSVLALIFLTPYIIHQLGASLYGIWILVTVVTGYAGLTDLGIGTSLQKFVAEHDAKNDPDTINGFLSSGIAFYVLVGVLLLGVSTFVVNPLLRLFDIGPQVFSDARTVFFISLGNLIILNVSSVFGAVLNGLQYIDLAKRIEMGMTVARVGLYVLVLSYGYGIVGVVLAETSIQVLGCSAQYFYARKMFPRIRIRPWRLKRDIIRRLVGFGGRLQVSRVSEMINLQFDRIVTSKFVGIEFVVFADVGGRLLGRLRVLPLVLLSSVLPAVSQLQALRQEERIRLAFERSTKYLVCTAVPLFVFIAVYAHAVIRVWFDSAFELAAWTLQILALGYLLNVLTGTFAYFAQGLGDVRPQMKAALLQACLNIVLSIVLAIQIGYFGIMAASSFSLIVGAIYFGQAFDRILPGSLTKIVRIAGYPVVASLGATAVSALPWFAAGFTLHSRGMDIGLLVLSGALFAVSYAILLRQGGFFDRWDADFLERISPKYGVLRKFILTKNL